MSNPNTTNPTLEEMIKDIPVNIQIREFIRQNSDDDTVADEWYEGLDS